MGYLVEDLASVLKGADSIIINSEVKVGKMTFSFYLIKLLFNEKALIFSSQESYLFNKKLTSLSKQFRQFSDIENYITRYSLNEEWSNFKRQYGYEFLLTELERIISMSEEKLILFHRLGEFFEFQDRYEIEHFYNSLVKIVTKYNKKIIFIVNNKNQNYKYIQSVSEEFSDIYISLLKNEKNERLVEIKNILTHEEYPLMQFVFYEKNFILKHLNEDTNNNENRVKNILIMELNVNLNSLQTKMVGIYQYIFNRPEFNVNYADSFQSILHNIFIKPDIIIVLMKRNDENFLTIKAIKKQLPETTIISVLEQDFVRSEDIQKAYDYGCDELFPRTYLFDTFILAVQKSIKLPFYSETLKRLPKYANIVESKDVLKELAIFCIENTIFFTIFTLKKNKKSDNLKSTMRRLDYMYINDDKIYYLALNTMPENINIILEKQYEKFGDKLDLISISSPLNLEMLEEYFSC